MRAISYRKALDYVAKATMRRNYTWGADVELFAVVISSDIWVFSSDIGKKWMVFASMGAKLIDALESFPADCAGSIYLNHNGAHY